jgi:hypothetical protein
MNVEAAGSSKIVVTTYTFQKTVIFIATAVRISNLTK